MEAIQQAVLSLEDRNEQECLRCRYIDVIEDEEGNRKRLTWRDVALRVYRKDDENAIRATTRLHKRALESIKGWRAGSSVHVESRKQMKKATH